MPTGQVSHVLAPTSAYFLSSPHAVQVELPGAAYFPAEHDDTDPDVQVEPVGHTSQDVRVVPSLSPPFVWNPDLHVRHEELATASLYLWFAPHVKQVGDLAGL